MPTPADPVAARPAPVTSVDLFEVDGGPLVELIRFEPSADERALLARATAQVAGLVGERAGCILVVDGIARVVLASDEPDLRDLQVELGRYPEVAEAIAAGYPSVVEDVALDPRLDGVRHWIPSGVRAIVAVPLATATARLGALVARSSRPGRPQERALATAVALARLAALLVERRRLLGRSGPALALEVVVPSIVGDGCAARESTRRRVLLVEDEPHHAELVATVLERRGYLVQRAGDGAAGLDKARAEPPDLILLDVRMPAVDGFAAAAELRRDERTREVPILFLSAWDEVGAKVRGLELGAVDYLAKPFHGAELLARVERTLAQAEARDRLRAQARADHLTGLGNFRFLQERLAQECARAARYQLPLAVAMIDVDKLKRVNDVEGHAAGNALLKRVGRVLQQEARDTDSAARYGGDEFVVVLPHTALDEARHFGERVRRRLAAGGGGTVSIGLAALPGGGAPAPEAAERLLAAADGAVYQAKRAGGDRTCLADPV